MGERGVGRAAAGARRPAAVRARRRRGGAAASASRRAGDTCHLDVADRWGNLVSATPSGGWLQSSPAIPALGFCLGTRAQMFWLEDGLPASLAPGSAADDAVAVAGAARRRAVMAFGTPGGDQQDQWSLKFFLAHVVFGLDLQAAIDAPMFHIDALPELVLPAPSAARLVAVESRLGERGDRRAARRGHDVTVGGAWSLGRVTRSPASRGSCGPPRTRAACRAMPSDADPSSPAVRRLPLLKILCMESLYDQKGVEARWQQTWEAEGLYNADADTPGETSSYARRPTSRASCTWVTRSTRRSRTR